MTRHLRLAALLLSAMTAGCSGTETPATQPAAGWIPPPSSTIMAYADCLEGQGVHVTNRVAGIVLVDSDSRLDAAKKACRSKLDEHLKTIGGKERKVKDEPTKTFIDMIRWCTKFRGDWDQPADEPVFNIAADAAKTRTLDDCIEEIRAQPPAETGA